MKKIAILMVVICAAIVFLSSCNNKVCPTYSSVQTERAEQNG